MRWRKGELSIWAHARTHRDAAVNFGHLTRKYDNSPDVRFTAFDNTQGPGRARRVSIEETVKKLSEFGILQVNYAGYCARR